MTNKVKFSFDNSAKTYDSYAILQNIVARHLFDIILWQMTFKNISKKKVLDVGCGTGFMGNFLCNYVKDIVQLDISYNMCKIARKKNSCLSINCDMEWLPFKEESFDVIVSSMSIQWSKNIALFLNTVLNYLKKGGCLFVSVPILGTFKELLTVLKLIKNVYDINSLYTIEKLNNIVYDMKVDYSNVLCCHYRQCYRTFRDFLMSLNFTGTHVNSSKRDYVGRDIFKVSKMYDFLYSAGKSVFVTWKIAYIMIRK